MRILIDLHCTWCRTTAPGSKHWKLNFVHGLFLFHVYRNYSFYSYNILFSIIEIWYVLLTFNCILFLFLSCLLLNIYLNRSLNFPSKIHKVSMIQTLDTFHKLRYFRASTAKSYKTKTKTCSKCYHKVCKTILENKSLNQRCKPQPGLAHASQNKNNNCISLSYILGHVDPATLRASSNKQC